MSLVARVLRAVAAQFGVFGQVKRLSGAGSDATTAMQRANAHAVTRVFIAPACDGAPLIGRAVMGVSVGARVGTGQHTHWGESAEAAVWPPGVVFVPPVVDQDPRFDEQPWGIPVSAITS